MHCIRVEKKIMMNGIHAETEIIFERVEGRSK